MYSNAGPVMLDPSGLRATGSVMVVLKFAVLVPADLSQPLKTMVYPRGMKKAFASAVGSVTDPGSLPPGKRPSVLQVLLPRFGGSYMTLWAPFLKSIGLRM